MKPYPPSRYLTLALRIMHRLGSRGNRFLWLCGWTLNRSAKEGEASFGLKQKQTLQGAFESGPFKTADAPCVLMEPNPKG